ncbi:MAG: transporter [Gemmatimonadetes bacterium]|jgi:KUP system potassium uptake protein|nr:transporter [Gemmatimonadota bacterium]
MYRTLASGFIFSMPATAEPSAGSRSATSDSSPPHKSTLASLSLAALGVVYGDIGTSPIYALRESLHGGHGVAASATNVLGLLSLILWALILVISVKYLLFVMRADNGGEGGMIALTALVAPPRTDARMRRRALVLVGLFGASLLYGDGMITPAISVLSAVEGLEVATPIFVPYVVPITIVILVGLFAVQRRGTASIGAIFGPVMLLWFATLALLGVVQIVQHPAVLAAVNPVYGFQFFQANGWHGYLVLGSVFLAVTGGEALYADMGHFGLRPIRLTWFAFVLPSLLLNYFGQGALVLTDPSAAEHPFFRLAPHWALLPLVALTTLATVIASQAVISGAFSLTRQAVQLGYLPRVDIEQTSETQVGQIYIPGLNWLLMIACIGLVLGFRSSSRLAAAYGVAVTTDMVFTAILFAVVARSRWRWSLPAVVALTAAFLSIDLAFWGASLLKIPSGGWFPILIAGVVFTIMTTWYTGRAILADRISERSQSVEDFLRGIAERPPLRVPGTAIYLARDSSIVPHALVQNLKHNKVLHERVVLLALAVASTARADDADRVRVEPLSDDVFRVVATHGFTEEPAVPAVLEQLRATGFAVDVADTTFFLGRETLLVTERPGMALWRERLFALLARNARRATKFFHLPTERVVELGAEIEL